MRKSRSREVLLNFGKTKSTLPHLPSSDTAGRSCDLWRLPPGPGYEASSCDFPRPGGSQRRSRSPSANLIIKTKYRCYKYGVSGVTMLHWSKPTHTSEEKKTTKTFKTKIRKYLCIKNVCFYIIIHFENIFWNLFWIFVIKSDEIRRNWAELRTEK